MNRTLSSFRKLEEVPPAELMARLIASGYPQIGLRTDAFVSVGMTYVNTFGIEPKCVPNMKESFDVLNRAFHHFLYYMLDEKEDVGEKLFEWKRYLKSTCRINLLNSICSDEVRRFVCEDLSHQERETIISYLPHLQGFISRSFSGLASFFLDMFVDPTFPEEKNIRINIWLRKSETSSFQEYLLYNRQFLKLFPSEFRKWFRTSINYI